MTTPSAIIVGSIILSLPIWVIAKNLANLTHIYRFIHGNIMRIANYLIDSKK